MKNNKLKKAIKIVLPLLASILFYFIGMWVWHMDCKNLSSPVFSGVKKIEKPKVCYSFIVEFLYGPPELPSIENVLKKE